MEERVAGERADGERDEEMQHVAVVDLLQERHDDHCHEARAADDRYGNDGREPRCTCNVWVRRRVRDSGSARPT